MKLKPNCLLTRRPVFLIPSVRSLFFYQKPWGNLESVLFDHGYKVSILSIPFNRIELRQKAFYQSLSKLNNSHIVIDQATYVEFENQLSQVKNSTITVTTTNENKSDPSNYHIFNVPKVRTTLSYILHKSWLSSRHISVPDSSSLFVNADHETFYRFIDHCVKLAELDFMMES